MKAIPHISTNHSYAEAAARRDEIARLRTAVERRLREVEDELRAPSKEVDPLQAAEALLRGDSLPSTGAAALRQEHLELRRQAELLQAADAEQQALVREVVRNASRAVSGDLLAQHRAIAKRALEVLMQFDRAQQDEVDLVDEARRAGYEISFPETVASPIFGRLYQQGESLLWRRVHELTAYVGGNHATPAR